MTVIRDAEGSIYGGYVDAPWSSNDTGKYASSTVAFLFCLVSSKMRETAPFKMPILAEHASKAIYCITTEGPDFGGNDLCVSQSGKVQCGIGGKYAAGPTGATISSAAVIAVSAMEVWQLADA